MGADRKQGTETLVLRIGGMTCSGCERRIEAAARGLEGVLSARAEHGAARLSLVYDPAVVKPDVLSGAVGEAVAAAGYSVLGPGAGRGAAGAEAFGVKQLVGIAVLLVAGFVLLQRTGLLNRIPQVDASMGYGVLFLVGLLTSLHCVGMCGGINLSQTVRGQGGGALARLRPALLYNGGRVISYTLIGGIAGALGSLVSFSGAARGWLVFAVGLFMLLMGLNLLGVFPWLKAITPRLPGSLGRRLARARGSRGPFVVGLLNGLMPCGPLQSVQLYALAAGSFAAGALSMLLFSLGTVPLMFGLGALGSLLTRRFARRMVQVSALVVMLLGVAMAGRGLNQTGSRLAALQAGIFSGLPRRSAAAAPANVARIEGGVQLVRSRVGASSYEPIIVQSGIPVRWTIEAPASALNGCNNPVTIPQYDVVLRMTPGENQIEFTPEREGDILYTCWMGMISSTIRVVGDLAAVTGEDLAEAQRFAETSSSGSGESCCSPGGVPAGPPALDADYRIPTEQVAVARIQDGVQYVSLSVDEQGYTPAVLIVQRGVPTEWTFQADRLDEENYRLVIAAYQTRFELGEGANTVTFDPTFDFTFDSWTGTLHGYVKVVDDLASADLREIRAQVGAFAAGIREQAEAAQAAAGTPGSRGGADSL